MLLNFFYLGIEESTIQSFRQTLYPLGFLASLSFFTRFMIQWLYSEKKQESLSPKLFWYISLLGNCSLILHSTIQVQFPVALTQCFNLVFSLRNLEMMQKKKIDKALRSTACNLCIAAFCISFIFIVQGLFLSQKLDWVRSPQAPWPMGGVQEKLSLSWHILGSFGIFLFSSRFWVQWWISEKKKKSHLPPLFWWISILGSLCSLSYFIRMLDWVNILGQGASLLPAIRNLQLLSKEKTMKSSQR